MFNQHTLRGKLQGSGEPSIFWVPLSHCTGFSRLILPLDGLLQQRNTAWEFALKEADESGGQPRVAGGGAAHSCPENVGSQATLPDRKKQKAAS